VGTSGSQSGLDDLNLAPCRGSVEILTSERRLLLLLAPIYFIISVFIIGVAGSALDRSVGRSLTRLCVGALSPSVISMVRNILHPWITKHALPLNPIRGINMAIAFIGSHAAPRYGTGMSRLRACPFLSPWALQKVESHPLRLSIMNHKPS
jgi:MFS family permease